MYICVFLVRRLYAFLLELSKRFFSDKPDWGPFNPARETTFEFMEKFLASVRGDFPDNNIHIGGDEVDISCWLEFLFRGFLNGNVNIF